MKKKLITALVILLVVGSAIVLLKTRKANLAKAPVASILPVMVESISVQPQEVTLTLPAMGIVSSDLSTTLSTKVSGRILKLYKREGDAIKKGDLLVQIDDRELKAKKAGLQLKGESLGYDIAAKQGNLKALQTALQNANESHARTKELLDVKGASIEQYNQEETGIAQLKAQLQSAKSGIDMLRSGINELSESEKELDSQLSYTRITAPTDGTLSARLVMAGDLAVPGKALLKIAATDGLYLDIKLPSDLKASAILLDQQKFPLVAKNQAGGSGLREYRAALPLGSSLVEGEFLNVALVLYTGNGVLLPNDVLLSTGGQTSVLVYTAGKVSKTTVTIVRRGSEGVMVAEDLSGKTLLLAKPDILLRATSGVPVKILSNKNV
ncbi:efflux RND transporter periplasmic adaptor subunit [Geopsychrobacter electrodiphilus]|uniref:efflux RND transporter periplasmic adaptor subunit n=1 Tax=Geopsychrobacter electrodiphilus TaxID=225196 RepID=UPI00037E2F3C|nr:biotin/lipoyl-binding protein [Geopsychrobacter electrodiphilus]